VCLSILFTGGLTVEEVIVKSSPPRFLKQGVHVHVVRDYYKLKCKKITQQRAVTQSQHMCRYPVNCDNSNTEYIAYNKSNVNGLITEAQSTLSDVVNGKPRIILVITEYNHCQSAQRSSVGGTRRTDCASR